MMWILLAYLFAVVPVFSASDAFFAPNKAPLELSLTVTRQNLDSQIFHQHKKRSVANSGVELNLIGSQTFYHAEVRFGSAGNIVTLMVDTGSTSTWVVSKDVKCYGHSGLALDSVLSRREDPKEANDLAGIENVGPLNHISENGQQNSLPAMVEVDQKQCTGHGFFDSKSSTTFEEIRGVSPYNVQFQDSTFASGVWARDTISFGDVKLHKAPFALVGKTDNTIGILGLGSDNLKHIYDKGTNFPPDYKGFPHLLKEQGLIERAVFSLHLDHDSESGSVLFGAVDHARYSGNLQTVPLANYYSNYSDTPLFYDIMLDSISIESAKMPLSGGTMDKDTHIPVKRVALLDSGSTLCAFSLDVLTPIAEVLHGEWHEEVQLYAIDFEKVRGKLVVFRISSIEITIPVSRLLVKINGAHYLGIMLVEHDRFVLGEEFLRHAYVVFDAEENKVSMAQARASSETQIEYVLSEIPRAVSATTLSLSTDHALTPETTTKIPETSEMARKVHFKDKIDIIGVSNGIWDDDLESKLVSDKNVPGIEDSYAPKTASSTTDDHQDRGMDLVINHSSASPAAPFDKSLSKDTAKMNKQSLGLYRFKHLARFWEHAESKHNNSSENNTTLSHIPTDPDLSEGITIEDINQVLRELEFEASEENMIANLKPPAHSEDLGENQIELESFENFLDQELLKDSKKLNRTRKDTSKVLGYGFYLGKFDDANTPNKSESTFSSGSGARQDRVLPESDSSHKLGASEAKEKQKVSANSQIDVPLKSASQKNKTGTMTTLLNPKAFENGTSHYFNVTTLLVDDSSPSKKCPFGQTESPAAPQIHTENLHTESPKNSSLFRTPFLPMPTTSTAMRTESKTGPSSQTLVELPRSFATFSAFGSFVMQRNTTLYQQSFSSEKETNDCQNGTCIENYNSLADEMVGDAGNKTSANGPYQSGECEKSSCYKVHNNDDQGGKSSKTPYLARKEPPTVDSGFFSVRASNESNCSSSCAVCVSNDCSVLGTGGKTMNKNGSETTEHRVLAQSFVSVSATFEIDEEYGISEVQSSEAVTFEGSAIKSARSAPFFVMLILFGLLLP
ncbi:aspartyl protease [Metschnikowia aff. pulcherrima]|uniref:candidapepsin n=1 Tax=Metschnikowia aff. pulcherrima TaxID=2163413 RepID=A0A4P6XRV7_9ASCO|nr:aspartyl protease [Metschnikowia aff. pulcherrima]